MHERANGIYKKILNTIKPADLAAVDEAILFMACMRGLGSFDQHQAIQSGAENINTVISLALGVVVPFAVFIGEVLQKSSLLQHANFDLGELTIINHYSTVSTAVEQACNLGKGVVGNSTHWGSEFDRGGIGAKFHNWIREQFELVPGQAPVVAAADKIMRKHKELRVWHDTTIIRHISGLLYAGVDVENSSMSELRNLYVLNDSPIGPREGGANARTVMLLGIALRQLEKTISNFRMKYVTDKYKGVDKIMQDLNKKITEPPKPEGFFSGIWNDLKNEHTRHHNETAARQQFDIRRNLDKAIITNAAPGQNIGILETIHMAIDLWYYHNMPQFLNRINEASWIKDKINTVSAQLGLNPMIANKHFMLKQAGIDPASEFLGEIVAIRFSEDYGFLLRGWHSDEVEKWLVNQYLLVAEKVSTYVSTSSFNSEGLSSVSGPEAGPDCYEWLLLGMAKYIHRRRVSWMANSQIQMNSSNVENLGNLLHLLMTHRKARYGSNQGLKFKEAWISAFYGLPGKWLSSEGIKFG